MEHCLKNRIAIVMLLFLLNIDIHSQETQNYWDFVKKDSITFDCYSSKYRKHNWQSKLVFLPITIKENNYFKLLILDSLNSSKISFNLFKYSNDTIYIIGRDNSENYKLQEKEVFLRFNEEIDTIREIGQYKKFGTLIQFQKRLFDKELKDTLYFYKSFMPKGTSYGRFLNLFVLSKKTGFVFYTYYDGRYYFYIKSDNSESYKIEMITKILKEFKNPTYLEMFTHKVIYPDDDFYQ